MGAEDAQTLAGGTSYLKIQMVGMLTVSITTTITNALRAVGDSKTSMRYNLTANLVNVVFNYLLIYGHFGFPRLEVTGASLATVIGQFVGMLMAMYAILRKDQYVRLEIKKGFKPDVVMLKNIWHIGMPAMMEQLVMRIGIIIYAKTVASLGTVLLAAHQVCMNIQALTFMNGQSSPCRPPRWWDKALERGAAIWRSTTPNASSALACGCQSALRLPSSSSQESLF